MVYEVIDSIYPDSAQWFDSGGSDLVWATDVPLARVDPGFGGHCD